MQGWIKEVKENRVIYTKNEYQIVKYSSNDWSVYMKDYDGIYQFQLSFKRKKDAFAHCC